MTWTARNNGLSGDALNVNDIAQHPSSLNVRSENHELFIATDGGVFRSTDGGRNWAQLTLNTPDNSEFGDDPAPTADDLTYHWVDFDPNINNLIYVLAANSTTQRIWLYRSTDKGETWANKGVSTL